MMTRGDKPDETIAVLERLLARLDRRYRLDYVGDSLHQLNEELQILSGLIDELRSSMVTESDDRNAAAAVLGRRGGLKGGASRRQKLTAEQRRAIAQKAVRDRWAGKATGKG